MTIIAEAFVRIRPDDKDFPKQVETSARQAAQRGSTAATKELKTGFGRAGRESHTAFLSAFSHFGDEIKHRFFAGLQFGVGAFTGIQAFSALEKLFGEGFQSEKLFQTSTAQLNTVLKSTGAVSGETTASVDKLAERIANYSGETVNALRNSQVMLLGFTNIRDVVGKNNDIFGRASVAAEDLAKRYGLDASTAARTLGRALNDPARGLLLLRRAGIQLTAQQADAAKKLAAHGKVLEAQKVILKAVEQRVGGAAAAYGKTLPGQVDRAREQFNEFSRQMTEAMLPALTRVGSNLLDLAHKHAPEIQHAFQTFGSVLSTVVSVLGKVATFIEHNGSVIKPLIVIVGGAVLAFQLFTAGQRIVNRVMEANPFVKVTTLIIALAAGLIYAYQHSETFRKYVQAAFKDVEAQVRAVVPVVIDILKGLADAWLTVVGVILQGAADAFGWVPGVGPKLRAAASDFNTFHDQVLGILVDVRNKAAGVGTSGGDAFGSNFVTAALGQIQQLKNVIANVIPSGSGPGGIFDKARAQIQASIGGLNVAIAKGASETSSSAVAERAAQHGVANLPQATLLAVHKKITVPTFATTPDFPAISGAPKAASAAGASQAAKQVVARAVPLSLTAAEIVKAFAAAVQKGRPGVLAEITKLSTQIRTTLNQPAAHGARDQLIAFLEKRRASLGRLADQYVTITKKIDDATQRLTDAQTAQADFFSSLHDTFTSAGNLANVLQGLSDQVSPGGEAVGGFLQHQVNQLNGFLTNLDALKAQGLAPELIKQLATQGADTGGRLAAGLVGASQAQIARINALQAQLSSRATAGAQQLTNDFYQSGIDQLKDELANDRKELAKISSAIDNLEKSIGDDVGRGVAAGLNGVAAAANAKAKAKTRQASSGARAR